MWLSQGTAQLELLHTVAPRDGPCECPLAPATTISAAVDILVHVPYGPFQEFLRNKYAETGLLDHKGTINIADLLILPDPPPKMVATLHSA